jgi:hypothetical protein
MADRAFLKPRSVSEPPQGDFRYLPEYRLYEAPTAALLQEALNLQVSVDTQDILNYWVVEEIQYQVAVLKHALGADSAEMSYSAVVRATQVVKI